MVHNLGEKNSIANQYLSELRDRSIQQDRMRFRFNMQRLGRIMAVEISRELPYVTREIATPLGTKRIDIPALQPVLVTVLRAGIPYYQGFLDVFDQAEVGFIGAARQEGGNEVTIKLDYLATPPLTGRTLILIDPMLATGRSFVRSVNELMKYGTPDHIYVASLVSAPEGIQYIQQNIKTPFSIWTFALDEKLDHRFYIVPGLGDAGDLGFGEKV
ncbi:MAG TPA: uracil phosphoribosyltransferase [Cyclobacteriaceae bacterium]